MKYWRFILSDILWLRPVWTVENLKSVSTPVCSDLRNLCPQHTRRWVWRRRLMFEKRVGWKISTSSWLVTCTNYHQGENLGVSLTRWESWSLSWWMILIFGSSNFTYSMETVNDPKWRIKENHYWKVWSDEKFWLQGTCGHKHLSQMWKLWLNLSHSE